MTSPYKSSRDVVIRTESWTEATDFYESVLGFRATHRGQDIVGYETGSFCLYVERGPAHSPIFELLVPDINTARAQLLAAGCTVVEEDESVPRCYIRDPQGLTFNIGQAKK